MEIQEESSRKILGLNDDTGYIKFIVYCKSPSDLPSFYLNCQPTEKMYVKVVVTITSYQDKKIFICQRMDEIKNFNEYINHMIFIMHRSLSRQNPDFDSDEKENFHPNQNQNKNMVKRIFKLA